MGLHALDYVVLLLYALVVGGIGLYVARRQKSTEAYFIAARRIPAWAVAFTLMATLISSGTVIGHPATAYQKGLILLLGHLALPVVLLVVAIIIVPFYRRVVRMSAYEYIGRRFGVGGRVYSSLGFMLDRLFDIGVTLLTTAIPIRFITGWDLTTVILATAGFTVLYTTIGGIEAIVWTDVFQGVVLVLGALLLVWRLVFAPEAGHTGAVVTAAYEHGRFSLGSFELSWKSLFDPDTTTQWLFLLAYVVNWGRRYMTDQHMVQRYLIARTDREASAGAFVNALICVPIYMTFMFIGACLWGFYYLTNNKPPDVADDVIPYFIVHHMPIGTVGLILAAVLAASMSSISADLNSVATVLTADYFARLFPKSTDRKRLIFGKSMVLVGGLIASWVAILLIPQENSKPIMERVVTIAAILSGGTLGLFCLGFLTTRATRAGCYAGIAACLLLTAWGVLTEPKQHILDLGFNFRMNPILIGVFSHVILFAVGYVVSVIFGGYRPADLAQLTIAKAWRERSAPEP